MYCENDETKVDGNGEIKLQKPKKKRLYIKIIAVILAVVIALGGCTCALVYFDIADIPFLSDMLNKNVNKYSNKDTVYHPSEDKIVYDTENNAIFFNDMLMVYTFSDLSADDSEKLAKSVDGKIVGDISGCVNALQIKVNESTFDELNKKAEILMLDNNVLYAGYDYPISLDNTADNNPWSDNSESPESDRGNEQNPKGNDWWAEAIGAYTAWDNVKDTEKIKVGIIDSGFDNDHEDLKNSITFLPDYSENTETDHGTHVAGLIGAENNSIGIRGVADNVELVCADWSPNGDDGVSYLSNGEYAEIFKQMIENDVRVINNSWGMYLPSKSGYTGDLFEESTEIEGTTKKEGFFDGIKFLYEYYVVSKTGSYKKYIELLNTISDRSSLQDIIILTELFLNGKDDFLIVQGAGNGYDNGGSNKGYDTEKSGYFCGIAEKTFNIISNSTRERLSELGVTYKKIDEHILIVGAVKNKRDKNGNYQMRSSSNYGDNVDICAPGLNVYSTLCDNKYGNMSGTSMAAPIVSGAAALLWSCDMTKSAEEIRKELIESSTVKAVGVGEDKGSTYPMLNIGEAIKKQNNSLTVYDEVLNQYKIAIKDSLGYSENLDSIGDFVNSLLLLHSTYSSNFKVYYAFADINNDENYELIIGAGADDKIGKYDIFTNDGEKSIPLLPIGEYGERNSFELYDNGIIYTSGAGGATHHSYEYLKLPKESTALEFIDGYRFEDYNYYKTDKDFNLLAQITESDVEKIISQYQTQELNLEWIEIVPDSSTPALSVNYEIMDYYDLNAYEFAEKFNLEVHEGYKDVAAAGATGDVLDDGRYSISITCFEEKLTTKAGDFCVSIGSIRYSLYGIKRGMGIDECIKKLNSNGFKLSDEDEIGQEILTFYNSKGDYVNLTVHLERCQSILYVPKVT